MLSVILTSVPRQHVSKLNKHGNANKSPAINIDFLIAGLDNKYFFGKTETTMSSWAHVSNGWWAHELISLCECSSTTYPIFSDRYRKQTNFFLGLNRVSYFHLHFSIGLFIRPIAWIEIIQWGMFLMAVHYYFISLYCILVCIFQRCLD